MTRDDLAMLRALAALIRHGCTFNLDPTFADYLDRLADREGSMFVSPQHASRGGLFQPPSDSDQTGTQYGDLK